MLWNAIFKTGICPEVLVRKDVITAIIFFFNSLSNQIMNMVKFRDYLYNNSKSNEEVI